MRRCVIVAVVAVAGVSVVVQVAGQSPPVAPPSRDAIVAAARSIIQQARYAVLASVDEAGQPQSRVVDPFVPERDFTVWIGTNARTRKVSQIAAKPKVTLLYFDAPRASYVSLLGTAVLVRDAAAKAKWWKEDWASFYSNKNKGDDYVLIKVTPRQLEIVSDVLGMKNDPLTWRPVTLEVK